MIITMCLSLNHRFTSPCTGSYLIWFSKFNNWSQTMSNLTVVSLLSFYFWSYRIDNHVRVHINWNKMALADFAPCLHIVFVRQIQNLHFLSTTWKLCSKTLILIHIWQFLKKGREREREREHPWLFLELFTQYLLIFSFQARRRTF